MPLYNLQAQTFPNDHFRGSFRAAKENSSHAGRLTLLSLALLTPSFSYLYNIDHPVPLHSCLEHPVPIHRPGAVEVGAVWVSPLLRCLSHQSSAHVQPGLNTLAAKRSNLCQAAEAAWDQNTFSEKALANSC